MSNIIKFPCKLKSSLDADLEHVRGLYVEAGISAKGAEAAINELKGYLNDLMDEYKCEMNIPGSLGLTEKQLSYIADAHSKSVNEVHDKIAEKMGKAIVIIAGLVGRGYE